MRGKLIRGGGAVIVFDDIMQRLAAAGWTSYRLRKEKILPEGTLSRLRAGRPITTVTIGKLCELLGCQPGELMHYEPDARGE